MRIFLGILAIAAFWSAIAASAEPQQIMDLEQGTLNVPQAELPPTNPAPSMPPPAAAPSALLGTQIGSGQIPDEVLKAGPLFLKAVRDGDENAASQFLAPAVRNKLKKDFPNFRIQIGEFVSPNPVSFGTGGNQYDLMYMTFSGEKSNQITLRVFYQDGKQVEVDGWSVGPPIVLSDYKYPGIGISPAESKRRADQDRKWNLAFQFIGLNLLLAILAGFAMSLYLDIRSRFRGQN
jgi:hypothetical protein